MTRKRLGKETRQKEILEAALNVFREKGFVYTTLKDIIDATTLSKGGFYHYYNNTTDILHDLMFYGIQYRVEIMDKTAYQYTQSEALDFIADTLFEKIIDKNPYMDVYVQFLIVKENNESLDKLFEQLKEVNRKEFMAQFGHLLDIYGDDDKYDLLTDYLNSLIIGVNVLGAREKFIKNEKVIKSTLKTILK